LACVAVAFAAEAEKKEELQTAEGNLYGGLGYAGYGGKSLVCPLTSSDWND